MQGASLTVPIQTLAVLATLAVLVVVAAMAAPGVLHVSARKRCKIINRCDYVQIS